MKRETFPATMFAFILCLNERKFQSLPHFQGPLESGSPLVIGGKEAVVLGAGVTRNEAKARGTAYYNRVSEMHREACTNWQFQTQDVEASEPSSPNSDSDEEQ
ncbi:hypothetical protein FOCC_FOCC004061 [Frankliniella occidentalis]|nr:hypothetical protein FOCC_FOCC004061 [Frankliniella occidentalis]